MITLGIVSPCYNEEDVLENSAQRLKELFDTLKAKGKVSDESFVLFVNDGSHDDTWDLISHMHRRDSLFKGLNLAHNVGHQRAIMAGMMTAREWADGLITIDADLQDDLSAIEKMIDAHEQGADVVYGVKVSRQGDSMMKRLTATAFYKLQHEMGIESVFNHADFRFMSRKALQMLAEYPERNIYLRGLIPMIGLPSATVDDIISERTAGHSKYTLGRMLNLALDGITSFSVKPIYYIMYLGIAFIFVSILILGYVIHALVTGTAVAGWASLILSVWFVGGTTLIAMGFIGVYIGKIFNEVKRRPLYQIKELLD